MAANMRIANPDEFALLVVQQYLYENEYHNALTALENTCGLKFVESKLASGSQLMQMVYSKMEEEAAREDDTDLETGLTQAEEEKLLLGGALDFPGTLIGSLDGVFATNVVSVACWPGQPKVFVGTGDGGLQLVSFQCEVLWRSPIGHGGLLSLDFKGSRDPPLVLAGFMDGSVALYNANTGTLLMQHSCHRKYCVRVRWLPDSHGLQFVSASWDNTVGIHELVGSSTTAEARCSTLWAPQFAAAVQDVEIVGPGGTVLIVAVRESNYLRCLNLQSLQEDGQLNMNALGDDHVSFTATQLAASPCGQFLLVSTDGPRIIVYRLQGWLQVRNIYGLTTEQFHVPCALWHAGGFYVLAAAAAGHVSVFHVGTGKVVTSWKAHTKNTRALHYDVLQNVLVTGSFDRTCKVWANMSDSRSNAQSSSEAGLQPVFDRMTMNER